MTEPAYQIGTTVKICLPAKGYVFDDYYIEDILKCLYGYKNIIDGYWYDPSNNIYRYRLKPPKRDDPKIIRLLALGGGIPEFMLDNCWAEATVSVIQDILS